MSTNVRHARANRTERQTDDAATDDTSPARAAKQRPTAGGATTAEKRSLVESDAGTGTRLRPADGPWVRRCQRQFDPHAEERLANLVDEANLVVIDPGAE
ncbi:hypothetical protein DVK02_04235 [Halobellus sp. Atlit-31R]|nr:hypothetical protein DVK02_04235 [Halobellus sp. Atlit-31R]